jgi:hypothetical protein
MPTFELTAILEQSKIFLKHYEVQIVPKWSTEALVTIGKGVSFTSQGITSPHIPRDQRVSNMHHRHSHAASAALFRKFFGRG